MERAWIYCRVAYPDMDMLETQKRSHIDYAQKNHFTIVGITAEQGSGLDLSRKGLMEVFDAVNDGKMDVLLVKDLARLGRNWTEVYDDLGWLKEQHVRLICEDGSIPETGIEILHRLIADKETADREMKRSGEDPGRQRDMTCR